MESSHVIPEPDHHLPPEPEPRSRSSPLNPGTSLLTRFWGEHPYKLPIFYFSPSIYGFHDEMIGIVSMDAMWRSMMT
ncbi:hypothetical protein M6B38_166960 [Iris pallida]|uniref:Uncharacterized protein n=1 Tax=Iris pallida TaxID=29817 RepID=A0AAX6EX71_IRIPA|nr:hypothetical protein M6B38_166960 [Iris pallida]